MRRGLPTGLFVAGLFAAVSITYGSVAAGAVAVAGLLMLITSAFFLSLDSTRRE
jgi:hypothetical protein